MGGAVGRTCATWAVDLKQEAIFKQKPSLSLMPPFRGRARRAGRRVLALDRIKTPQGSGVVSKGRWGHQRPHTCTF